VRLSWSRGAVILGIAMVSSLSSAVARAQAAPAQTPAVAPVAVGAKAPDFSLGGSDGKTYHLAELRGKASVVLVIFRGVW
jgi:cytochrome oxidase Cu insertion factor (SCO1/SenC/PrrC family)